MKRTLLCLVLIGICRFISVAAPKEEHDFISDSQATLSKIDLKDGVNALEAQVIIYNYYYRHYMSICGGPAAILDAGNSWSATLYLGIAGTPYDTVVVDKITGAISSEKRPTVTNPKLIWQKPPRYKEK